jgi:uncharacterized BrkB/YihY/UPF0761 family membrane protein
MVNKLNPAWLQKVDVQSYITQAIPCISLFITEQSEYKQSTYQLVLICTQYILIYTCITWIITTEFLCLQAIHKPADCLFHGGCIWSVKIFFILWAGISIITPVIVLVCRWLLSIWHQHVCITQHSSKSCKAGTSTYQVHTQYIIVCTNTYSVHTLYRVMPAAFPDCYVTVMLQSCNSVFF